MIDPKILAAICDVTPQQAQEWVETTTFQGFDYYAAGHGSLEFWSYLHSNSPKRFGVSELRKEILACQPEHREKVLSELDDKLAEYGFKRTFTSSQYLTRCEWGRSSDPATYQAYIHLKDTEDRGWRVSCQLLPVDDAPKLISIFPPYVERLKKASR